MFLRAASQISRVVVAAKPLAAKMRMLTAFDGKLMNPSVGQRYRETILSSGGQRQPGTLVEAFLGRKPNSDAFYAEINGTR